MRRRRGTRSYRCSPRRESSRLWRMRPDWPAVHRARPGITTDSGTVWSFPSSMYTTVSPLPCCSRRRKARRFDFCGTFLEVTFTGCYPALCPLELGLSSSGGIATCDHSGYLRFQYQDVNTVSRRSQLRTAPSRSLYVSGSMPTSLLFALISVPRLLAHSMQRLVPGRASRRSLGITFPQISHLRFTTWFASNAGSGELAPS